LAEPAGSALLVDEYFASGDDRLFDELLACRSEKKFKSFGERWYADSRPWARRTLLRYVDDGCDRPHHRLLVKTLFKKAEAASDDEAMAHFLVAFDRLTRRQLVPQRHWDYQTRTSTTEFVLQQDPSVPSKAPREKGPRNARNPQTGAAMQIPARALPMDRFSRRTRRYLARRAFRYFRRAGRKDPARYAAALRVALPLYDDQNLQKPEQLLDAWGLVHALYWSSPVLKRSPHGVRLAAGAKLADLAPAPIFPDVWKDAPAFEALSDLAARARSRTVRRWSIALLKRDHADALRGITFTRLRLLLKSPHEEVQVFAAELLKEKPGLEGLPIDEWLELLKLENPEVLALVCELVEKTVHPDRLTLAQAVSLACAPAAAVAELGLRWARTKKVDGAAELEATLQLREARAPRVRAQALEWLRELLSRSAYAKPEHVRELVDAKHREARSEGLRLMDERFKDETTLWAALSESPYDDVRGRLVVRLKEWEKVLDREALLRVWATSLLAIHRGGKAKRQVVKQLAERIVSAPAEAEALLPLLGIALRSVRAPERRGALAALGRAAHRAPQLRAAIASRLPELKLLDEAVA
jgi:hypothetical protein